MLITVLLKGSVKDESQLEFEGRKANMEMLLATPFWRNITGYMENNKATLLDEQQKWQEFLDESIDPLLQELNVWSSDSAYVNTL
jgi:hypothetical protein